MNITTANWDTVLNHIRRQDGFRSIRAILLYGPPGTGKSAWAHYACGSDIERISLDPATPVEELKGQLGFVAENGGTRTVWHDGVAVRAMRRGVPLVLDEFDRANPDLQSTLHALLDDAAMAGITLPDGERVTPCAGYVVIATMNGQPQDLPDPLLDRFDLVLLCARPSEGILQSVEDGWRNVVERAYATPSGAYAAQWYPAPTARSVKSMLRLARATGDIQSAAILKFGEQADELVRLAQVAAQPDDV